MSGRSELVRREEQDAALDRRQLLELAVERRSDQALEDPGVPIVPSRRRVRYAESALAKSFDWES